MNRLAMTFAILAACATSGAAGWLLRGETQSNRPQLVATPRIIERCEKQIADVILNGSKDDLGEMEARHYAIQTHDCYQYGLVSDRYMSTIRKGKIGPYLEKFEADPEVWANKS